MTVVRTFRCWDNPDILKLLPGYSRNQTSNHGRWGDKVFYCEEDGDCDYAIVFNRVGKNNRYINCPPSNVWQIVQEPYIYHAHDWMFDDQEQYSKVLSHQPLENNAKHVRNYPLLTWYVNKTYDELTAINTPNKCKEISWVTSKKMIFPGHRQRLAFMDSLTASDICIEIFGKGINFLDDKWDGLASYKYSLAIENTITDDYWTEKITDCFLAYTLPIYCGCENIGDYFPPGSYIKVDITKPEEALNIIRDTILNNEWEKRLDAIKEARELVLNKYNTFAYLSKLIDLDIDRKNNKEPLTLKPYRRTVKQRLINKWLQLKALMKIKPLVR